MKMWNIDFDQKPHGAADCEHMAKLTGNVRFVPKADIGGSRLLPCNLTSRPFRQSQTLWWRASPGLLFAA
jgi:hypothetical protein